MPKLFKNNGSEISPCILAKVKFALDITQKKPKNNKVCSDKYWNEVLKIVADKYNKPYKFLLK
jgi:hypothetical protein